MPSSALPELYFGSSSFVLAAIILPIWIFKILIINFSAFLIRPSVNFWRVGPLTWCCWCVETSISAVLNNPNEPNRRAVIANTAEYALAEAIVNQVMSRVQAAASEVLMHAYANRRSGQIHLDLSEGNSGDSSRVAEMPEEDANAEENDRRAQFTRLRQTISQNEDAQTLCTYFAALLPFVTLFSTKLVIDSLADIIRLSTGFLCFILCDSYIQQVAASGNPSFQQRATMTIGLVFGILATSNTIAPVPDYNIWKVLTLQYAGSEYHTLTRTLLIVLLTDNFVKLITCLAKLILVMLPWVSPHQKRRDFQSMEYFSQVYRCILPAVQWSYYFLGDNPDSYPIICIVFAGSYVLLKIRETLIIAKNLVQSLQRLFETSNYGVTPTQEEIDEAGMCSICHEGLRSPTKLSCSHLFCKFCIDTWLDKEHTCPMCRSIIEKKDNDFKTGATSKLIRFY